MAGHQGPRSKSRGQPPSEVGYQTAQRVEEQQVEHNTGVPES